MSAAFTRPLSFLDSIHPADVNMPQELEHGTPFARDMRRIREARQLSVEDLHDETKIPRGLLEAFEEMALFDHPQFNRVYLRSFVRTYAQVLQIDTEVAIEALEEALSGRYVGSLAVLYLGEEPEERAEGPAGRLSAEEDAGELPGEPLVGMGEERQPAERTSGGEDVGEDVRAEPSPVAPPAATEAEANAKVERLAAGEASESWTAQSPPAAVARSTASRPPHPGGVDRKWMLGGALAIVVAALAWLLVSLTGGSEEVVTQPRLAADTVQAIEPADTTLRTEAVPLYIPTLGDTMSVRIVAAHGRVDPIRVTVDDDLRRPYWIDRGDSMTFQPSARIVIEELLDSVEVRLEGVDYPKSRRDEEGRIVITRDGAQRYFDALRQDA